MQQLLQHECITFRKENENVIQNCKKNNQNNNTKSTKHQIKAIILTIETDDGTDFISA